MQQKELLKIGVFLKKSIKNAAYVLYYHIEISYEI